MAKVQDGQDPFSALRKEKAARVKSTDKRQLANAKVALKNAGQGAVPPTLKLAAALPEHGKGQPVKRTELRNDVSFLSQQKSTLSCSIAAADLLLSDDPLTDPNSRHWQGHVQEMHCKSARHGQQHHHEHVY